MPAHSYVRGWPIIWQGGQWVFEDTGEPAANPRACKRCRLLPTSEGHDACLGVIDGVISACCGHGMETPYQIEAPCHVGELEYTG